MSIKDAIRDAVRQRVRDGDYAPGAQLPGVAALREEFTCSTATAVYAMRGLVDEGYVVARQGRGYFAAETLPSAAEGDQASNREAQQAIVASLRGEARRLQEIADQLDRTISS